MRDPHILAVFVVIAEKGYHISRACVQIKIQVQSENIRRKLLCRGRSVLRRVVIDQFTGTDRDLTYIVADILIGIAQINFNIGVLLGQLEDHRKRRAVRCAECHRAGITRKCGRFKTVGIPLRIPVLDTPVVPVVVLVLFHFLNTEVTHEESFRLGDNPSKINRAGFCSFFLQIRKDFVKAFFRTRVEQQLICHMIRHNPHTPFPDFRLHA